MKDSKQKKEAVAAAQNKLTNTGNELGTIKIHENVIASVVKRAVMSVEGVTRLAGSGLVNNLAEIVGSRKSHERGITVMIDESSVNVEVKVNIAYGAHIPTVASNLQALIMDEVNKSTGMKVSSVNVVIQEIEDAKPADDEEEDETAEDEG